MDEQRHPGHPDGHTHGHGHGQAPGGGHEHRSALDLDAEVFGDQLGVALDLAGPAARRVVVDLGAGSGTGSRLLRERHPDAQLTSVDADPQMIDALAAQGFTALAADLDEGYPVAAPGGEGSGGEGSGGGPDLVWTASALHHLTRPEQLLAGVRRALAPGGVLVVVELVDQPRFLGGEHADLEARCHAVAAAAGWNRYPDWTPVIAGAGFTVTRTEITTTVEDSPAARRYARQLLSRFLLLDGLVPEDRAVLEALLAPSADDLVVAPRASRTTWVATPDPGTPTA